MSRWSYLITLLAILGAFAFGSTACRDDESDGDADGDGDCDSSGLDGTGDVTTVRYTVIDGINAELCGCFYADAGFDSAEACIADYATSELSMTCFAEAYTAHSADVEDYFRCDLGIQRYLLDCYTAAACDETALEACEACADEFYADCPEVSEEVNDAFVDTQAGCFMGDPSGCPDDTATGTGDSVITGDTTGMGDDVQPSADCPYEGGGTSADLAYTWTAPAAGSYVIDTMGTEFDTLIFVLDGDCSGSELACNDDAPSGDTYQSEVTVELTEGQTIVIVVEGWGPSDFGTFQVNINAAS